MVVLDIEDEDLEQRIRYYEKMQSLRPILKEEYLPEAIYEDMYFLENGKELSRIYVVKENVSIHNKNTWREAMEFLNENMQRFEAFFWEYEDFIRS